jgi:hypothetical protein
VAACKALLLLVPTAETDLDDLNRRAIAMGRDDADG